MKSRVESGELAFSLTWMRLSEYSRLIKGRIGLFVVLSTAVGFVLGSSVFLDFIRLFHTLFGTFLISGGAATLNQFLERDLDAKMSRTSDRPLPSGRLQPDQACLFGLSISLLGILYLGMWVNWLVSLVGVVTSVVYLFIYTPLKQKTVYNTAVGALAGALPPVGGWAAARGEIGSEACALFAILFFWQFPHFFSIAWMYREDYARAGYRMLSVADPEGGRISRQIIFSSLVLLPISLLPVLLSVSGLVYAIVALILSLGLFGAGLSFARFRTDRCAKRLMRATLLYLPVLWVVMILDRVS